MKISRMEKMLLLKAISGEIMRMIAIYASVDEETKSRMQEEVQEYRILLDKLKSLEL